jgi:uncharacterized delta-60 repeat protein/uncharacterized repeat protein (TIGR02543 family)
MMRFFLAQRKKYSHFSLVLAVMLAVILTGCGGDSDGSGGSGTTTCSVTYNGNDQDGGSVPVDDNDYQEGQTVTVLGNTGNLVRAGYSFSGWNTQADGSGTTYTQDQTFTMGAADVILYAQWASSGGPGAAGDLDTSFGGTGVVTTPSDGMGYAVAIQGDGKILVAGDGASVVRYEADGDLDLEFGTDGIANLPSGFSSIRGMAVQGNGKIVVAGIGSSSGYRMAAARLNSDGGIDGTFGTAGNGYVFYSPFTSNGSYGAQGVAIQSDGKIVLAGETSDRFAVVRLTTAGVLDTDATTGFGPGHIGYVTTVIQNYAHANAVAIQDDGKIVVAGQSFLSDHTNHAASVARYNTDGTLDIAGWGGGLGYIWSTYIPDATALAIQNGRIVVTGGHLVDSHFEFAMIGFAANGWLDNTFGEGGFVTSPIGDSATAYAMAVSDEGILLAGHAAVGTDHFLAVARYDVNGGLDTTFGSPDGYVFTVIGASPYPYGLAIDSIGRIVVAGGQGMDPSAFFVARYLP